jgi:branched-chain amino acid aminotransferase
MFEPDPNTIVYFDGDFIPLKEARVNVLTHAFNYGTGVFEGIRAYWDEKQEELFLLRPVDHYERWRKNCGILRIELPMTGEELAQLTAELMKRNHFEQNVYIRPLAWRSAARVGVMFDDKFAFSITGIPFGDYLDSKKGIRAGVVSWRRVEDNAIPGRAKICGAYVNSALASDEARRHGYDEAIFLSENGHVAEGATCNIFMVRGGKLITPGPSENILEGITRDCIMQLARQELHMEVVERPVSRSELYVCDELFFTGTAVELAPITSVDQRPVGTGAIGPVVEELRRLFFEATRGHLPRWRKWLYPVYQRTRAHRAA